VANCENGGAKREEKKAKGKIGKTETKMRSKKKGSNLVWDQQRSHDPDNVERGK